MTKITKTFKSKILLFAVFLLSGLSTYASHFRYGTISYEVLSETGIGSAKQTTVKFTINQGWRSSYFGGVLIGNTLYDNDFYFGDGSYIGIPLVVTAINYADDWFLGTATLTHTYTGNVNVIAYMESCCRISTLQDGNYDQNYRNEAVVTLSEQYNDSPRSSLPAIVHVQAGLVAHTLSLSAIDPNGNLLSFAQSTYTQSYLNSSSIYTSIDALTGLVTLNTVGATVGNLHAMQFIITDSKGATTPIDFIVRIVGNSNPPFVISPTPATGTTFKVQPGTPVNFTIAASDVDAGDLVTILGSGIPVGALFLPGPASNPMSVPFSWTPVLADLGAYVVTFSATDNNFVQTLTTINIIVSYAPVFDVPPTPTIGIHNIVVPGNNISFSVQATDPDPLDVCQITSATGKDMMNNPIPLYSGVVIAPTLPSVAGNTTSIAVSWTPTQAQWGHRHMIFTATDGYFDETTHEVSILVNTPPSFNSSPVLTACVGQLYTYNVVVTDPDIAQGDYTDLFGINMPAWLSFTDNGNGTGTLSGTPGIGDVGLLFMSILAEDEHHHDNGSTSQPFSITVSDCGSNPCPPATVTIAAVGLNPIWKNQGANDPNTFYYGLVNTKRLNAKIVGVGAGPFTYSWSISGTGTLIPRSYYPDSSIDLLEPTAATTVSVLITDLSNGCQYTQNILINWNGSYFCGKTGTTWNILVCEGGVTKCVDWNTGKLKILLGASLGPCPTPKRDLNEIGSSLVIYPNPSNGIITLQYSSTSYGKGSIVVTDLHGRILIENGADFELGVQEHQLDMSNYANGIYIVKVISGDDVKTEKIQILK